VEEGLGKVGEASSLKRQRQRGKKGRQRRLVEKPHWWFNVQSEVGWRG